MTKKRFLSILIVLCAVAPMAAQNDATRERYEAFQRQAEDMMRQMSAQFKTLFSDTTAFRPHFKGFDIGALDSLSSDDFAEALPFGRQDTSFSRAFGFLFDGDKWQQFGQSVDSLGQSPQLQEFESQVEALLRGMTRDDFFQFPMLPQLGAPHWPHERSKTPEAEDKKNKKYKTEKL